MSDDFRTAALTKARARLADVTLNTPLGVIEDILLVSGGIVACWREGHPERPHWLVGRYQKRPWRCGRCHTWWVTELADEGGYIWRYVGTDAVLNAEGREAVK